MELTNLYFNLVPWIVFFPVLGVLVNLIIGLMTLAIAMMAFAPTYAAIGIAAPLVMVFARLLQGFATGGEFAIATSFLVESAPAHRRGFYGCFQQIGLALAALGGAAPGGKGCRVSSASPRCRTRPSASTSRWKVSAASRASKRDATRRGPLRRRPA